MHTDDLITLIAQDTGRPVDIRRAVVIAGTCGGVLAAAAFFLTVGPRHDFAQAAETIRFLFKFCVTLTLTAAAGSILLPSIRPGFDRRWKVGLLALPLVLLVGAVILELIVTPPDLWLGKLIGTNALHCLTIIPALSLVPAIPLFLAMRLGAPDHPGIAGAVAGLLSAGIAASLYATNCFDDSPLFVATWYPIATLIVAAVAYAAGNRLLRW